MTDFKSIYVVLVSNPVGYQCRGAVGSAWETALPREAARVLDWVVEARAGEVTGWSLDDAMVSLHEDLCLRLEAML
jgi:hypothetical protein